MLRIISADPSETDVDLRMTPWIFDTAGSSVVREGDKYYVKFDHEQIWLNKQVKADYEPVSINGVYMEEDGMELVHGDQLRVPRSRFLLRPGRYRSVKKMKNFVYDEYLVDLDPMDGPALDPPEHIAETYHRHAMAYACEGSQSTQCPICMETMVVPHALTCGHTFCGNCISGWVASKESCPTCRAQVRSTPTYCRALDEILMPAETEVRAKRRRDFISAHPCVTIRKKETVSYALIQRTRAGTRLAAHAHLVETGNRFGWDESRTVAYNTDPRASCATCMLPIRVAEVACNGIHHAKCLAWTPDKPPRGIAYIRPQHACFCLFA